MHVRQGKLSPDDVEALIFQSSYTRSTFRIKPHSRKEGKQCPIVVEGVPLRRYSATIAGGCRCISFLKMETTNLMIFCNSLGEVNIFNATKVNSFVTQELCSGKSPSTIQSRLYSLSRFLNYLKCYKPAILPNDKQLNDLICLIKGAGI